MFRTILVPLDGSPFAEHALPYALSIAERAGATLELINVYPPMTPVFTEMPIHYYDDAVNKAMQEQQQSYMDRIVEKISAVSSVLVVTRIVPNDTGISETVSARATEVEADLVILTTHGRGGLARVFLGSVADELVRLLKMPLLAVRPTEEEADLNARPQLSNMLVPVDGTAESEKVLQHAAEMAKLMKAEMTLVRVMKPALETEKSPFLVGTITEEVDRLVKSIEETHAMRKVEAEGYLEGLAEKLRKEGLTVESHVMIRSYPWNAILNHADEEKNDLIVLETHGRSGLSRLFLGSVTDKVLRGANVPVLIHRPTMDGSS